jgi:hypothetical protein
MIAVVAVHRLDARHFQRAAPDDERSPENLVGELFADGKRDGLIAIGKRYTGQREKQSKNCCKSFHNAELRGV